MSNPVLILGSEPRIAVPIARSLARRGIPVHIVALSTRVANISSRAVRRFWRLPNPEHARALFEEALFRLVRDANIDMVIPCNDPALVAVAPHYDRLSEILYVGCPRPQIVNRVLQKPLTVLMAKQCGVPVPETYKISSTIDLENLRERLSFPIVGKPASKFSSRPSRVRYFETFRELRQAFESDPEFGTRMLLQEYCQGEGVGLEVLFHDQKPIAIFQHRRLKELPSTGGASVLAISEAPDPVLVNYAVELLRIMEWEGVAMVEFRCDRSRQTVKLMEVNGRYWGSLSLSCMAGVDFPFYEWQLAHGQVPEVPPGYRIGLCMRWTTGELRRLFGIFTAAGDGSTRRISRWKELAGFVRDVLPPTRDALWSVTDPLPALQDLSYGLSEGLKRVLRLIIPSSVLRLIYTCRLLQFSGGLVYLKRRLRRALGMRRKPLARMPMDARFVLFVCHGNIIRSPMATALLRREMALFGHLSEISIDSAGMHATPGAAEARACKVAIEFGILLESHRTQPVTADVIKRADVIFVMDFLNEAELLGQYSEAAQKVFLLGEYVQKLGSEPIEIKDPYNGDLEDIRRCYHTLEGHIQTLATMLSSQLQWMLRFNEVGHLRARRRIWLVEPIRRHLMDNITRPNITGAARRYAVRELGRRAGVAPKFLKQWRIEADDRETIVYPIPGDAKRFVFPIQTAPFTRATFIRCELGGCPRRTHCCVIKFRSSLFHSVRKMQ